MWDQSVSLGSACAQPIQVVADNDIAHGAAHIQLVVIVRCCYLQTCLTSSQKLQKPTCAVADLRAAQAGHAAL